MSQLMHSLGETLAVKSTGISLVAAISVVAQVATAALIVGAVGWRISARWRHALSGPAELLREKGVWLAWGVAVVATASSLWLSEYKKFDPCHLCDLQRFYMYPLVVMLAGVALVRRRWASLVFAVYPLIGLGVSVRHVYVEVNPAAEAQSCKIGAGCAFRWVDEFGYVTIPVMAGTAFLLIAVLLIVHGLSQPRQR
jgi:disulfide bond formation protein DsbB